MENNDEKYLAIQKEADETSRSIAAICKEHGMQPQTFYSWKVIHKRKLTKKSGNVVTRTIAPEQIEKYRKVLALMKAGQKMSPSCRDVKVPIPSFISWSKGHGAEECKDVPALAEKRQRRRRNASATVVKNDHPVTVITERSSYAGSEVEIQSVLAKLAWNCGTLNGILDQVIQNPIIASYFAAKGISPKVLDVVKNSLAELAKSF